jgi:REP element-mobilizing transposase RayT
MYQSLNFMASSLSKVYLHLIFSTKNREKLIDKNIEKALFGFLFVSTEKTGSYPIIVGGYLDHVHILFCLPRTKTISKVVEHIKSVSSKWIKQQGFKYSKFYWQKGYAIFSVEPKGINKLVKYIQNQEIIHEKRGFKEECRSFFKDYKIDYDERFVWD